MRSPVSLGKKGLGPAAAVACEHAAEKAIRASSEKARNLPQRDREVPGMEVEKY